MAKVLLRQSQKQRFLRREVRQSHRLGAIKPAIAKGLGSVVAFDFEMLAQHLELPLHRAQVAVDAGILNLLMNFFGGDLPAARDPTQDFQRKDEGLRRFRSLRHQSLLEIATEEEGPQLYRRPSVQRAVLLQLRFDGLPSIF